MPIFRGLAFNICHITKQEHCNHGAIALILHCNCIAFTIQLHCFYTVITMLLQTAENAFCKHYKTNKIAYKKQNAQKRQLLIP